MMKTLLASVVPLVLVLGACGDDDDTTSGDTVANSADQVPQVTFDGSDCVYEGPEQMTAGVVAVEFVNNSDGNAGVQVGLLDEGKTVQDYADYMGAEPYQLPDMPPWMSDMGGQPPAAAGETITWEADLAPGVYALDCSTQPFNGWLAGGFTVVEG